MFITARRIVTLSMVLVLFGCSPVEDSSTTQSTVADALTPKDAIGFIKNAETQLAGLLAENERMAWVHSNFITSDTEVLSALANKNFTAKQVELAIEAAKYTEIEGLDSDTDRKLNILRRTKSAAVQGGGKRG